jgi:hypothetical protein
MAGQTSCKETPSSFNPQARPVYRLTFAGYEEVDERSDVATGSGAALRARSLRDPMPFGRSRCGSGSIATGP